MKSGNFVWDKVRNNLHKMAACTVCFTILFLYISNGRETSTAVSFTGWWKTKTFSFLFKPILRNIQNGKHFEDFTFSPIRQGIYKIHFKIHNTTGARRIDDYFSNSSHQTDTNRKMNSARYAVIGCTFPQDTVRPHKLTYLFLLPLTVLAWRRIGFQVKVLFFSEKDSWYSEVTDKAFKFVLEGLQIVSAHLYFVDTPRNNSVMMSQVGRLFTTHFLQKLLKKDDYLITSDADVWPIQPQSFLLPESKDILVLNAFCCGVFKHKAQEYSMHPMSNIGANAETWRKLINQTDCNSDNINNSYELLKHLVQEFGESVVQPVKYAGKTWTTDQKLLSINIQKYLDKYGEDSVHFVRRLHKNIDRLDRLKWRIPNRVSHLIDSHVVHDLFLPKKFHFTYPLFKKLYPGSTVVLDFVSYYIRQFYSLIVDNFE